MARRGEDRGEPSEYDGNKIISLNRVCSGDNSGAWVLQILIHDNVQSSPSVCWCAVLITNVYDIIAFVRGIGHRRVSYRLFRNPI